VRVIGIDPGTRVVGFGVIEAEPQRARLIECGVIRAKASDPEPRRLLTIFEGLQKVLQTHRPDVACVEDVFAGKDTRSALKIGEGRGVALVALAQAGLEIHHVAPARIKKSIAGNGRADKEQVQRMVCLMLSLDEPPSPFDATDAVAAALFLSHRLV
jgi:crossover junction endodeoxyribonuclease RuvC